MFSCSRTSCRIKGAGKRAGSLKSNDFFEKQLPNKEKTGNIKVGAREGAPSDDLITGGFIQWQ